MNIFGKITGIKYTAYLSEDLTPLDIGFFDINDVPSVCLLTDKKHSFAISKWISPKRTRSYSFERIYNTLRISKKITVIPIVKDEGVGGDRDFIQWDTVSLISLLDVYVIFAYYEKAEVASYSNQKITKQQFDNAYILSKVKEIEQYHSSALHWNLNELNTNLHTIIDKAKLAYLTIEKSTNISLHNISGLDDFKEKIGKDVASFMLFSRGKAKQAQAREFVTTQPKESLSTLSKAKITISNYLGRKYFLTVDEVELIDNKLKLIECKHSKSALLPSKGDIKDGLLKMILYCNLVDVIADGNNVKSAAVLCLTSPRIEGAILSTNSSSEIENFISINNFSSTQINIIQTIFQEAGENQFIVKIQHSR